MEMQSEKTVQDASTPAAEISPNDIDISNGVENLNASGHKQQLERQFSLFSLSSVAITAGNQWVALGGSIVRLS